MLKRKKTCLILIVTFCCISLGWIKTFYNDTTYKLCTKNQEDASKVSKEPCHCEKNTTLKDTSQYFSHLDCKINEDVLKNVGLAKVKPRQVNCLITKEGKTPDDVYVPFSFVKSYFDVTGEVRLSKSGPSFSWSHSYSRIFPRLKETKYDPGGPFIQFAGFDVESRPRVKCVTASQAVPLTTQWDRNGYYYPTQIAQYALSHWSKHIEEKSDPSKMVAKTETVYEDGDKHQANWLGGDVTRVTSQNCIQFESTIHLPLNNDRKELILGFDLRLMDNVTISLSIRSDHAGRVILKYAPNPGIEVDHTGRVITFGYGIVKLPRKEPRALGDTSIYEGDWKRFTRNLLNDLSKGLPHKNFGSSLKVEDITFEGVGCVTNLSLSTRNSIRFFYHAADWLLSQQDSKGGWPVSVTLNKDKSKYLDAAEIAPGWYSGMGQGHAMSVLVRAYLESKNLNYLTCAMKALKLFQVPSAEGGIVAKFMETHVWYEEYPTNPSSFTLNGFMYSLLGLYDLWVVLQNEQNYPNEMELSEKLFTQGLSSLQALLPLFDTGSGTVYDLRHYSMGGAPKVARWDYHSTHINLLLTLSTLCEEKTKRFFIATAERWQSYMIA